MKQAYRVIPIVLGLLFPHSECRSAPIAGKLFFIGVAYDEAPERGQTVDDFNYAPDNFSALFQAQSKDLFSEIKIVTLKGNAAGHGAVMTALRSLKSQAAKEDLVFLYWGTHGATEGHEWSADLPRGGPITGSEIKAELARLPCPAVVAISTCGSGGFIRPVPQKIDLPANVAAFAACQRRQSTNNELDVTLLEALAGFGDLNRDGQVTLREAIDYVPRRYRKLLRDSDEPETFPVLGQAQGLALDRPLTKVNGQYAAAVHDGQWYGATILERNQGQVKVRYLGWDPTTRDGGFSFPDEALSQDYLDFAGGEPPVDVEWKGEWYPAVIRQRTPQGRFKIHYVGYPESDDETVGEKRIRYPFVEFP